MLKVDGIEYNVCLVITGRSLNMLDGEEAGRAKTTGQMKFDTKGVYPTYSVEIEPLANHAADYDNLVEVISDPKKREHYVEGLPYKQTTISYYAYFSSFKDVPTEITANGNTYSGGTVDIIATKPTRTP